MKIALFYFSGTGSTWWVVDQFKQISEKRNHIVDLYNIEKTEEFDMQKIISELDIIGFGYPIYGSDIPKIMKTFLKNHMKKIDVERKLPVLVLTSMLFFSGDGALLTRKYLDRKKFQMRWTKNISLTSNISIPGFKVNPIPQERLDRRMVKAEEVLENLILDIENDKKRLRIQWGLLGWFLGGIQRIFERSMGYVIKFSADSDRCIKCLKCVKECPVENILYDEISEKFTFLDKCVWCMRCYTRCPTQAILVRGRYCDPEKYKRLKPISKDYKIR